jgi:kynureninase
LTHQMAKVVGGKPQEVVVMNTLTVNLHLMMVSFYRPTKERFKVIIEADAFPSDRYAVESQIKFHGFDPKEALILWQPNPEDGLCHFSDFEQLMHENGQSTALVMLGNSNYYSGQVYPIRAITDISHHYGATVGFNLAHGAGNILCDLHENQVDFAVWCTYKYLNSGPGSLGGVFVHQRHAHAHELPRFTGWWGHNKETRFKMRDEFDPIPGAEGWQLSNPPILSMAAIRASLDLFDRAGMKSLREKSIKLTGFLADSLNALSHDKIRILTPIDPAHRGAQLSLQIKNSDKTLHQKLTDLGVVSDWREPDVIRVAPAPLYNSFQDVHEFVQRLSQCL